ncbi:MAG: hypothetical protein HYR55_05305 [Acidobacteria bacterium]|nr:hypothetical protein [Acidobacteriota bacterium]MBI3658395.1 hypothetical protein [Acidobacteriota bacterium]
MPGPHYTALDKVLEWIYIVFCFEIGVFLMVAPWMTVWETNDLWREVPWLRLILLNGFVRGGISGLGIADLLIGGKEAIDYFKRA